LSEAITAGQTGHVAAHNDIHDVVNEAARTNVVNTFTSSQTINVNGGKTTLALTNTTLDVGITIGGDTNLYRGAANILQTDDQFRVNAASGNANLRLKTTNKEFSFFSDSGSGDFGIFNETDGGSIARWSSVGVSTVDVQIADNKWLKWSDVNLYRSAANTLKTDDEFAIGINGGKDTLALTDTTVDVGITIGGDTNLYRSAANTLKTDDAFSTAGVTTIGSDGWAGWFQAYGVTTGCRITYGHSAEGGDNNLGIRQGQIVFGAPYDTNLYRSAADVLKTDDEFIIGINGGKDTLALTNSTADVGLTIGGDTNLYRSAANELATDDIVRFNAAGTFQTTVGAAGGGSALPATPTKYLKIKDEAGTTFVVPCYAAA
jgi:NAD kinase